MNNDAVPAFFSNPGILNYFHVLLIFSQNPMRPVIPATNISAHKA
jgi:hypothetical protein